MNLKEFLDKINGIKDAAFSEIKASKDKETLEGVRVKYLGSKGLLSELSKAMLTLERQDRPEAGKTLNQTKEEITLEHKRAHQEVLKAPVSESDYIDVTLPGRRVPLGHRHLITRTSQEICHIFEKMGLTITEGPEVETDYYNFEALNFPQDHPSRDMQQTLFVGKELLLRTHTSCVQIRTMEKTPPPVWIVVPGKTYRRDDDLTHSPMFNQVEGLVVDKGITMADLKGMLAEFARQFFSQDTKIRLRPSFFPFTEPSAEVDIACVNCGGKGCRICKGSGWLEVLGCGMVNPALYKNVGYDPKTVTGFAFGIGVDRMAMLKYHLDNISRFYAGDVRYMRQFPS
ncbi:MAG: phenylalanine--tRNA ligase subunit alpha [Deltaproteobacteria bacterium]|jgi:phenylalanyl-tRNA synthetase alpha chain|nr:phenylalanine--tRNA ligase subunit alpha [Deltaproteobacteria bacterium]